jgi:hypothetical protein
MTGPGEDLWGQPPFTRVLNGVSTAPCRKNSAAEITVIWNSGIRGPMMALNGTPGFQSMHAPGYRALPLGSASYPFRV